VHPNCGVESAYRVRLRKLLQEMHDSITYWITAEYRKNEPVIAMDALPANELRRAMRQLAKRWQQRFNEAAPELADYFSKAAAARSDGALKAILEKAGFTVKFKMTKAARDILRATMHEQVNLIRSIPQQYLVDVQGMVMRSVQTGRDLATLTKQLEDTYGVSRRRAALIARDQNNKATSAMIRARQAELGITEAIWLHSGGGKHPRPTHVRNSGKRYDIAKGWYDPDIKKFIFPGELINCRCVSRSVLPSLTKLGRI